MATIISEGYVCDGYDVYVKYGHRPHLFHFLSKPNESELNDVIIQQEKRMLDEYSDLIGGEEKEVSNEL